MILLSTNASGSIGLRIFMHNKWAQEKLGAHFKNECDNSNITILEYFPILVSTHIFEYNFTNKKVLFPCDNEAVVEILNGQTSKCPRVMDLVRPL